MSPWDRQYIQRASNIEFLQFVFGRAVQRLGERLQNAAVRQTCRRELRQNA